ncbi:MAG: polysaccharide biosynthesis tyrosine autokinase [Pseudomonadota bacterium]|nr:polysaccharide biosynthesis tyrosine autokinase [Pseudomonadota bacterium]
MSPKNDIDVSYLTTGPDIQEEQVDLAEYLEVLASSKWLIAAILMLTLCTGLGYLLITQPIYSVDALLQVEEKQSSLGALDDVAALFEDETPVNAEIEILRSRMVIGKAVDNLKLHTVVRLAHLPVVGSALARRAGSEGIAPPWLGWAQWPWGEQFAWGGEQIQVETFAVPDNWLGKPFAIVAEDQGRYRLLDQEGQLLLNGRMGQAARTTLNGEPLELFVSQLQARPGTRFELVRHSRLAAIKALNEMLRVGERGKQSGMVELHLEGPDPAKASEIINEVANLYVRQNVERKSAEAEQTLAFLEQQLPALREKLETAEAALNAYRLEQGSVDLTKETQVVLEKIVQLEAELIKLKQSREELIRQFTPAHPRMKALDAQMARISAELAELNQQVKNLPDTQQEVLRLSRDVQVNTELYTSLLNSAQELRVAKAGTLGNVRIVDYAVPPHEPVKPRPALVLAVTLVLGLFLGVIAAFIRRSLRSGVDDPDLVEKHLGLPVYATIPHSRQQHKLARRLRSKNAQHSVLAEIDPDDMAVESLRSLRTTLHFALLEAKNNIIMITGPSPGVGKSFVSANLGAVLASAGKRVLLIDADLRKGYLNQYLGLTDRNEGLSDLISGTAAMEAAVHATDIAGLDIIPTGSIPPNPSELLLHERFTACLNYLAKTYDHVLIDSPPVLAVTDAAIIGRQAGAALLVVKAGFHPLREIEQSVKRLRQAGVNLRGLLFNDIEITSRRYGYGKYVYQYAYKK